MKDLAKLANVSVSTVSKAFSGAEDINKETKNRIFEIAKQTGCYGKFHKGKYHKKIIGVIVPEIVSDYYKIFLNILGNLIEKSGCIMLIATDDFSTTKQVELIDYFSSYLKVDGILVFELKNRLKKAYDTPIISLFGTADDKVDSVKTNLNFAMQDAVDLLIGYGHKKIAFLGERLTTSKAEIFERTLRNKKIEDLIIIESSKRFEQAGIDCVRYLLENHPNCSAVICAYDNIAIGAIKEFKRHNLKIPEDISVIGIDNISVGEHSETALTTIDTNPEQICEIAWDLITKKLKNPYFKSNQNIEILSKLIVRESVKVKHNIN